LSFPDKLRLSDSIASKLIIGGAPTTEQFLRFNAALNLWEFVPNPIGLDISVNVGKSVNQSILHNTLTVITWDTERYDTDNMHDNAVNNQRITFNTAGKYAVLFQSEWASDTVGIRILRIRRNGLNNDTPMENSINANGSSRNMVAGVDDFASGDFIDCQVFQTSGAALSFEALSTVPVYFSAYKVDRGG